MGASTHTGFRPNACEAFASTSSATPATLNGGEPWQSRGPIDARPTHAPEPQAQYVTGAPVHRHRNDTQAHRKSAFTAAGGVDGAA